MAGIKDNQLTGIDGFAGLNQVAKEENLRFGEAAPGQPKLADLRESVNVDLDKAGKPAGYDVVLLDTAGRYTTQDSHAAVDKAAWLGFLDLLKQHRRRRPISGALIAISVAELMQSSDAGRAEHEPARTRVRRDQHRERHADGAEPLEQLGSDRCGARDREIEFVETDELPDGREGDRVEERVGLLLLVGRGAPGDLLDDRDGRCDRFVDLTLAVPTYTLAYKLAAFDGLLTRRGPSAHRAAG